MAERVVGMEVDLFALDRSPKVLVLLCHTSNLVWMRKQHGHRASVVSKAAAIRTRKVVMDEGAWRCVRWTAARLVMLG
jgi:hypothetical protein